MFINHGQFINFFAPVLLYSDIADAFAALGQTAQAQTYYALANQYATSVELFKNHINQAIAYFDAGQTAESFAELRRAERIGGDAATLNWNYATFYRLLGDPANALKHYQRALSGWEDSAHYSDVTREGIIYQIGALQFAQKNFTAAITAFQQILDTTYDQALVTNALGNAYAATGEYEKALTFFQSSIALNDRPETHLALAFTYYALGRIDKAQIEVDYVLLYDPQNLRAQQLQTWLRAGTPPAF